MSDARYVILRDKQRRDLAKQYIEDAPADWVVTVRPSTRSLEQNALIHAALTDIGKAIGWKFNGQAVDIDDLKTIFMAAYRKASGNQTRFVMGIDGQPIILNWRTRDLTKKECSEFIDMVYAWLGEHEHKTQTA